jgi:hypothetical protein
VGRPREMAQKEEARQGRQQVRDQVVVCHVASVPTHHPTTRKP